MNKKHSIWAIVTVVALTFLFVFTLVHRAHGQTPAKSAAATHGNITEIDRLKMANIDLKLQKIVDDANRDMEPLQMERAKIIGKITTENPGYTWHFPQNDKDFEGLVKKEEPAKEKLPQEKAIDPKSASDKK